MNTHKDMPIVDDFLRYAHRMRTLRTYEARERNRERAAAVWAVMTVRAQNATMKALAEKHLAVRLPGEEGDYFEVVARYS